MKAPVSQTLSEKFDRALVFAHALHRNQKRKTSGYPYFSHPLSVAALVLEDGGSEEEAIAALLHDTIEDQSRHYPGGAVRLAEDIGAEFGPEVRRIVEACTEKRGGGDKAQEDRRSRWRAHKEAYFKQILEADASVRRVSCADSLHNVRTMVQDYRRLGDEVWTRFLTKSRDDQVWAYQEAARAFMAAGVGPMAEELGRAVSELAVETENPKRATSA